MWLESVLISHTPLVAKVELAVKKVLEGRNVKNASALRNPESLAFYKQLNLK